MSKFFPSLKLWGAGKINKFLIFGIFLFALFGFAHSASATTYYVATTGSDSNSGSLSSPFKTIQKAADIVQSGDTVIVGNGTYTDTDGDGVVVYVRSGHNGPIIFKSQNKWGAKLDAQSINHNWFVSSPNITIQDFEITGGIAPNGDTGVYGDGAAANYLQIVGNHFHDIGRVCTNTSYGNTAIYIDNGASHITIERNLIHDIGRYAPSENGCIPSNQYYQNHDHGIYLDGGSDITVKNNTLYNIKRGWAVHVYPYPISNLNILNNSFAYPNPWESGHIIFASQITNAMIANNIFYHPANQAFNYYNDTLSNVVAKNNLVYGGTIDGNSAHSGISLSGNIENADPKFVDLVSNDFRLQTGSPAINAGVTLAEVTTDLDGVARPQGSAYDIGAYEYPPTSSRPSAADLNSDSKVNSVDAAILMGAWGQTSRPKADINQDGIVNSVDASMMMGQWSL